MVCEHLQHLYQLCTTQQIRLSSSELVRFVCKQCDKHDTCPSNLMEYGDDPYGQADNMPSSSRMQSQSEAEGPASS